MDAFVSYLFIKYQNLKLKIIFYVLNDICFKFYKIILLKKLLFD